MKFFTIAIGLISICFMIYVGYVCSYSFGATDEDLTEYTVALALNHGHSDFITYGIKIFGNQIQLVNSPYMGALKSWLITPLFFIFKASIPLVITINIFLALIYLICLFWAIQPFVGTLISRLIFWIPLLDSKFLFYGPFDYGPIFFQMIFIALSIGGIFRFWRLGKFKWWCFSNFTIMMTLAQKITALPIVIVFFLVNTGLAFSYLKSNRSRIKLNYVSIFCGIASLIVPLIPHLIYFKRFGLNDFFGITADPEKINFYTYGPKLYNIFSIFLKSFDGEHWVRGITISNDVTAKSGCFGYLSFLVIVIAGFLALRTKDKPSLIKAIGIFALSLMVFSGVRGLTRSHHYFVLQPMWIVLFLMSVDSLLRRQKQRTYQLPVFFLALLIPSGLMTVNSIYLLKEIRNRHGAVLSSVAIDDVVARLVTLKAKKVYGLNFSISAPIYFLSNGVIATANLTWIALTRSVIEDLISQIKRVPGSYLVARHSTSYEWSQDWMDYLNRDSELSDLLQHPEHWGVDIEIFKDSRGTTFYILK